MRCYVTGVKYISKFYFNIFLSCFVCLLVIYTKLRFLCLFSIQGCTGTCLVIYSSGNKIIIFVYL